MIPGTTILTGTIIIPYTGRSDTHGDIILLGVSASRGATRIIIPHGTILTGMVAIMAATGILLTVIHTGMVTDMDTTTHIMVAIMVIGITIITDQVVSITEHVQGIPQAEQQPHIPLIQEI